MTPRHLPTCAAIEDRRRRAVEAAICEEERKRLAPALFERSLAEVLQALADDHPDSIESLIDICGGSVCIATRVWIKGQPRWKPCGHHHRRIDGRGGAMRCDAKVGVKPGEWTLTVSLHPDLPYLEMTRFGSFQVIDIEQPEDGAGRAA